MLTICFHGAESTGKTTFAESLAGELACTWVPEYGRTFAETRGTDFSMGDLLAIAEGQDAARRAAAQAERRLLILDTDPLMTAAWAQMLFGTVPQSLLDYPKGDFYILFAPDMPWIADGTRFFGAPGDRKRFADFSEAMLDRAGVPYQRITGDWDQRRAAARAILQERLTETM